MGKVLEFKTRGQREIDAAWDLALAEQAARNAVAPQQLQPAHDPASPVSQDRLFQNRLERVRTQVGAIAEDIKSIANEGGLPLTHAQSLVLDEFVAWGKGDDLGPADLPVHGGIVDGPYAAQLPVLQPRQEAALNKIADKVDEIEGLLTKPTSRNAPPFMEAFGQTDDLGFRLSELFALTDRVRTKQLAGKNHLTYVTL